MPRKANGTGYYLVCEGKTKATLQVSRAVVKFIIDHKPKIVEGTPTNGITITRIREVNKDGNLKNSCRTDHDC